MIIPERLETARTVLRPLRPDDLPAWCAFLTDEEATRYLTILPQEKTARGAELGLEYIVDAYGTADQIFVLAAESKQMGAYIGSCGLGPLAQAGHTELFYTVIRPLWNQGFGTEIAAALVDYALTVLNLPLLVAYIARENPASARVAQKLHMRYAGLAPARDIGPQVLEFRLTRAAYLHRQQADTFKPAE